ncbi:kinase-like protein [Peniophora sp. CONT]|nr:kinase-like protein [Peniophora sp. CONT]
MDERLQPPSAMPRPNLLGCQLDEGRLLVVQHLARGSFGAIYRVLDYEDEQEYALKVIFPAEETDGASRDTQLGALLEVAAHTVAAQHGHPGVLKLLRTFIEPTHGAVCIVLEYCEGGSLFGAVSQGAFWADADRVRAALLQILDALIHCHEQGVAHRDVKPENILLVVDHQRIVLADFGLASVDAQTCSSFGAGSKPFQSPECSGSEQEDAHGYDPYAADVWAFGIVFCFILTGICPWDYAHPSDKHFAEYLRDPNFLFTHLPLTRPAAELLAEILEPSPCDRITLPEVRAAVAKMDRFVLNVDELDDASSSARDILLAHGRRVLATRFHHSEPSESYEESPERLERPSCPSPLWENDSVPSWPSSPAPTTPCNGQGFDSSALPLKHADSLYEERKRPPVAGISYLDNARPIAWF